MLNAATSILIYEIIADKFSLIDQLSIQLPQILPTWILRIPKRWEGLNPSENTEYLLKLCGSRQMYFPAPKQSNKHICIKTLNAS